MTVSLLRKLRPLFLIAILILMCPTDCKALGPDEILVVANRNVSKSIGLANYYMAKRHIPAENIIKLRVTDKETCSRYDYEKKIAEPVRKHIGQSRKKQRIRCIVLMYGMPLRVSPPELTKEEKGQIQSLNKQQKQLLKNLSRLGDTESDEYQKAKKDLEDNKKKISNLNQTQKNKTASLDSEIALVSAKNYELAGWIPNPYYIGHKNKKPIVDKDRVRMVARLDGPSEEVVKRVIDDSLFAEENGLKGRAYFDARWKRSEKKELSGYAFYDQSIHYAADNMKKSGLMPVTVDDNQALFQPGDCPDAALYCGWYSLAKYVDAFDWVRGSIGYHIASSECATLKRKGSRVWCKKMLEDGIVATVGPVGEPYVQAFPVPAIFFGFLVDGYLTLAECYLVSTPFLSWKMVLIGDPLYRPFQNR